MCQIITNNITISVAEINIKYLIKNQMARTKQTARKSTAQIIPRAQLVAQKIARKSAGFKVATKAIEADEIDEDAPMGFSQFSLKFDDQKQCQNKAVAPDIIRCSNCEAILTIQSKIYTNKQYQTLKKQQLQEAGAVADEVNARFLVTKQSVWICEFCCQHMQISAKYQPPKESNPCFIMSKGKKSNKKQEKQAQDQLLIFVIDVSPSMGNNVTKDHTRIDCVRTAVQDEVNKMKMEKSTRIVGLITFGSEVVVYDHKANKTFQMSGSNFQDFKKIAKEAAGYSIKNWGPINKNHQILSNILKKLPCSYGTAIGPALLTSVQIAAKGPAGSRVIICTDGEANVGIGCHGKDDPFYQQIGQYAKQKGVSVSVLGIKGVDVNLKQLGKTTHATGGTVMKVDPLKIGTQFSKIINEQIIGINSKITVRLNKRFIFKNVDKKLLFQKNTLMKQDFGNFSTETQLTFEFQTLTVQQAHDQVHINLDLFRSAKLPMQIQLQYTGLDGTHFLQVVTDWRQMGGDAKDIAGEVDFSIFIVNALQKISKFVSEDQLDKAGSFYKQVQTALKQSVAKSKEAKQDVQRYKKRLQTLKNIIKKRSKKQNLKIFKDQSESEAIEDNDDQDEDEDEESGSRSRSRQVRRKGGRGGRGRGKGDSSKSRMKSKRGVKSVPKGKKKKIEIQVMSSSEQEAFIYKQMRATGKQEK